MTVHNHLVSHYVVPIDSAALYQAGWDNVGVMARRSPNWDASGAAETSLTQPVTGDEDFRKNVRQLRSAAPDALTDSEIGRAAIIGMTDWLDDVHTGYMTPERLAAFIRHEVTDLGIETIGVEGGRLVRKVYPRSNAERAGILPGDTILRFNGLSAERPLAEAGVVPGKPAELLVMRPAGDLHTRTLTPVEGSQWQFDFRVLHGNIAHMTVAGGVGLDHLLLNALDGQLAGLTPPCAWLLDLRGNGGGFGSNAAYIGYELGLRGDFTISTPRNGNQATTPTWGRRGLRQVEPLVVLVDEETVSAAEMLAAALQRSGHARVIGQATPGAFEFMNILPLNEGALRYAGGRVELPGEHHEGRLRPVVPDEEVSLTAEGLAADFDAQLEAGLAYLRRQSC